MSEHSGGIGPSIPSCKSCGNVLPSPDAQICVYCRSPQYQTRQCIWCYQPIASSSIVCPHCQYNQNMPPRRKPCILCKCILNVNAQYCLICCAPQDLNILHSLALKHCCNPLCNVPMLRHLTVCYRCRCEQASYTTVPSLQNASQPPTHTLLYVPESITTQLQLSGDNYPKQLSGGETIMPVCSSTGGHQSDSTSQVSQRQDGSTEGHQGTSTGQQHGSTGGHQGDSTGQRPHGSTGGHQGDSTGQQHGSTGGHQGNSTGQQHGSTGGHQGDSTGQHQHSSTGGHQGDSTGQRPHGSTGGHQGGSTGQQHGSTGGHQGNSTGQRQHSSTGGHQGNSTGQQHGSTGGHQGNSTGQQHGSTGGHQGDSTGQQHGSTGGHQGDSTCQHQHSSTGGHQGDSTGQQHGSTGGHQGNSTGQRPHSSTGGHQGDSTGQQHSSTGGHQGNSTGQRQHSSTGGHQADSTGQHQHSSTGGHQGDSTGQQHSSTGGHQGNSTGQQHGSTGGHQGDSTGQQHGSTGGHQGDSTCQHQHSSTGGHQGDSTGQQHGSTGGHQGNSTGQRPHSSTGGHQGDSTGQQHSSTGGHQGNSTGQRQHSSTGGHQGDSTGQHQHSSTGGHQGDSTGQQHSSTGGHQGNSTGQRQHSSTGGHQGDSTGQHQHSSTGGHQSDSTGQRPHGSTGGHQGESTGQQHSSTGGHQGNSTGQCQHGSTGGHQGNSTGQQHGSTEGHQGNSTGQQHGSTEGHQGDSTGQQHSSTGGHQGGQCQYGSTGGDKGDSTGKGTQHQHSSTEGHQGDSTGQQHSSTGGHQGGQCQYGSTGGDKGDSTGKGTQHQHSSTEGHQGDSTGQQHSSTGGHQGGQCQYGSTGGDKGDSTGKGTQHQHSSTGSRKGDPKELSKKQTHNQTTSTQAGATARTVNVIAPRNKNKPKGFCTAQERDTIKLIFKAIIPTHVWIVDAKKPAVYMRFGHDELGKWEYDYGPGKLERDLGDGFVAITFTVSVKVTLLKHKKIQYKYLIYGERTQSQDDAYEYLHELQNKGSIINRILEVPPEKCVAGTFYRQYDTMICPTSAKTLNKGEKVVKWVKGKVWKKQEEAAVLPHPSQMRRMCLEFHLVPFKSYFLDNDSYDVYEISVATDNIVHIFQCCYQQKISATRYLYGEGVEIKLMDSVKEGMLDWLMSLTEELTNNDKLQKKKQLSSAVTVHVTLMKLVNKWYIPRYTEDYAMVMLKMISLSPSGEEYKYLEELMKRDTTKSQVLETITDLFTYIVHKNRYSNKTDYVFHLLKILPIIHFLRGDCKPHQTISLHPSASLWGDNILKLNVIHFAIINKTGFIQEYIDELKMLFPLDPLIMPALVYLCPKDDLPLLCEYVPLSLIIGIISRKLKLIETWNREADTYVIKPLAVVEKKFLHSPISESIKDCIDCLSELSTSILRHLNNSNKDKEVVVAFALASLAFVQHHDTPSGDTKKQCQNIVETFLKEWICKSSVIGGSIFGGSVQYWQKKLTKLESEINIWEFLLQHTVVGDFQQLPSNIECDWIDIVVSRINCRMADVPKEIKVNMFCDLEKRKNIPDSLANIFMNHAAEALNDIFTTKQTSMFSFFERAQSSESLRVAKLFGDLLKKRYPHFEEKYEVPLIDLLEWDLWPGFLKIYAGHSKFLQETEQDWQIICTCARSQFEGIYNKILSGDVTMNELIVIKPREQQMAKLCEVVTATTGSMKESVTADTLKTNIDARLKEFKYFTTFKDQFHHLITHIKPVSVEGFHGILALLQRDNSGDPINSLCTTLLNGKHHIKCFSAAECLFPYIEKFFIISKKYANALFNSFWLETLSQVECNNKVLTFQEVIDLVWKPVSDRCVQLLNNLQTCKIQLSEIDEVLKERYSDRVGLMRDIEHLSKAVSECCDRVKDFKWIKKVSDRIWQYWELCSYHEPAKAFLKIRDSLALTGDFSLIDRVARKVVEDQTLESIDQSVVEASSFLQAYAADKRKRECLEAFAECQKIANWIRNLGDDENETKDVNDLQNFVNIALATAAGGEGDFTTDKLSYLRTVGSGFGPLIYKLPKDADYQLLQYHCKDLWETLEEAGNLPEILRVCESEIPWYQSIRETQGSVEKSSFGQMRNINELGYYEIGSIRKGILSSRSEAIRLQLRKPDDKKVTLPQYRYSLDELRDLESKLVLITGPESSERQEVDRFLDTFHSVCRIADVLIELQHHGNSDYIGWSVHFPCDLLDVFELLQYQAKVMEAHLENWMNEIRAKRDKFYELNYYTTPQLLALSEELGQLSRSSGGSSSIKAGVMNLLRVISRNVTSEEIKVLLKKHINGMACIFEGQESSSFLPTPPAGSLSHVPVDITANDSEDICEDEQVVEKDRAKHLTAVKKTRVKSNAPAPKLQFDELTDKQKSHLLNLEGCGYHQKLILLAFEGCARPDIQEEVAQWCVHNESNYEFSDSEDDDDFSSEEEEEVGEEEEEEEQEEEQEEKEELKKEEENVKEETMVEEINEHVAGPQETLTISKKTPHSLEQQIEVIEQVPVDKNHPNVQKLMELGFSLEQCIDAVDKYPNNTRRAMEYITTGEAEEHSSTVRSFLSTMKDESKEENETYGQSIEESADDEPLERMRITKPDKKIKSYLSLDQLGILLQKLSKAGKAPVYEKRPLPEGLKQGEHNLLVVPPDHVLKSTISIYMENTGLPLPTHEEVLVCSDHTTAEEVILLWKRALGDPLYYRIFCLVNAEKLPYHSCEKALFELQQLSQGKRDYRIVIICSNEDEDKSHIVSKLQAYRRPVPGIHSDREFMDYLKIHFIQKYTEDSDSDIETTTSASSVDKERSCVRVVTSERAGMGKSLYIYRLTEDLMTKTSVGPHKVIIPIHGPKVTSDSVVNTLMNYCDNTNATIFHLDISPNVLRQVDSILFCLLVLQAICDSKGSVWRCHPTHMYAIEVTIPKTEQQSTKCAVTFLNILPTVHCISPRAALRIEENEEDASFDILMDKKEFKSSVFQRAFQYLRRHKARMPLDRFSYLQNSVEGKITECLNMLLSETSVKDPSWSELRHFVCFLDIQLKYCEQSLYCDELIVGDCLSGLKTFTVNFMIRMSKDFSTASLRGEVAAENEENNDELKVIQQYEIHEQKTWQKNYHPYLFFNEDGCSITFVGFNVNRNGDLMDPVKNQTIQKAIMTPQLYAGLQGNHVDFSENYHDWEKQKMIEKISMVMGIQNPFDPDPSYVLTVDNVIKILAILMKFRCNIPVVIMGETGCGKTRLIRYMCDLAAQGGNKRTGSQDGKNIKNMLIMKVHGGSTEADIIKKVEEAEELAEENKEQYGLDTVLFFDEANTTDAIDLIKEVMCDHHISGREITRDVKFIAACNPYRKHLDDMIAKLESAGLGFYVKANETQEKLGEIPLRQLVYRVFDLPPSMRPLVYDFGQLDDSTENDYTKQMVHDRCSTVVDLNKTNCINAVADVLTWSQSYMKKRTDECSFVSLRDIERALIVFKYFYEKNSKFEELIAAKAKAEGKKPVDSITWSLIISLSVCYHARLQVRDDYEKEAVKQFRTPLDLPGGVEQFRCEIKWCQDVLLDNMKLGPNIARNAALRENVFMMAVCIQLRIPLFLVGKPGSSKSLAKSIIADSMLGKSSEKDFLKDFNEVHMFSYQCSQLSTPESVIEVFNTAKNFQEKQSTTTFVSVVVLDEVGLAEDSPNLPLKALHPLLEDGTEEADDSNQIIDRQQRVAFVGISNWALDPAKMNRGVMVTRGDPDEKELKLSAEEICSSNKNDSVKEMLNPYFEHLAAAYKEVCEKQSEKKKSFFGLRDFYSLVKMLYWMCDRTACPPTEKQLEHAIKRNFGGLEELNTYDIFMRHLAKIKGSSKFNTTTIPEEDHILLHPDCTPLGLIETSLMTKETSWHGENRYLLFLTENYAALEVLKHKLHEAVGISIKNEESTSGQGLELNESERDIKRRRKEPFVLFGSSFPKDREYTQVCRNINQIKICMETGRTVILLNLENLYESLYDLLNQYYIFLGNSRYVDLGLQTHRVKCRVDNEFKLILIAEKETVYKTFPTPLINRLEKHFVLTETILLDWQKEVLKQLKRWVEKFCTIIEWNENFRTQDAFVGFQHDTPASVIFQVTKQLRDELNVCQDKDLTDKTSEVFKHSCYLLLQMANPDALIRLQRTALADQQKKLCQVYFSEQYHDSIIQFLQHHIENDFEGNGVLIQVTTHSHLLSISELKEFCNQVGFHEHQTSCFLLQEFDTELDFTKTIDPAFSNHSSGDNLLIIQCDSGHLYGDLVACARYRIDDEKEKALRKKEKALREKKGVAGTTHVLFIIHLPRRGGSRGKTSFSFVGFQGGSWISAHIDDIHVQSEAALTLDDTLNATISELFYNMPFLPGKLELTTQNIDQEPFEPQQIEELEQMSTEAHVDCPENQQNPILEIPSSVSEKKDIGLEEMEFQNESEVPVSEYQEEIIQHSSTSHSFISEENDGDKEMEVSSESFKQSSISEENNEEEMEHSSQDSIGKDEEVESDTSQNEENGKEEEIHPDTSNGSTDEENEEEEMDSDTSNGSIDEDNEEEEMDSDTSNGSIDEENDEEELYPEKPAEKQYTQCRRLYHCIQAVVAKIAERDDTKKEWAARRVKLLLELVPKNPTVPLCVDTFYGALVRQILSVLKQREEVIIQDKEWVLNEALDGRNLQSGGTFQNVLARKLDKEITPIFATILSFVDNYSNLEIMKKSELTTTLSKQQLWLQIFNNQKLCTFSFDKLNDMKGLQGTLKEDFTCKFPFFWLIKEVIDSKWESATSVLGTEKQQVHVHLCEILNDTPVNQVLSTVPQARWEDLCQEYLYDYLLTVHHVTHHEAQQEYEVLFSALYPIITGPELSSIKSSLMTRLVGVHVAYQYHQKEIMWLGQLISLIPGILVKLHGMHMEGYNDKFMDIHLHAVQFALEDLELPLDKDTREHFPQRLLRLQLCQNTINSIIEISFGIPLVNEIRGYWHYIRLIQLFVEHVALKYQDLIVIAKRFEMQFPNKRCDFSRVDTIKHLQNHLKNMEGYYEKQKKLKSKISDIQKCTKSFFTEVVSTLCFDKQNPPESDLIIELIATVFDEQMQYTKDFSYSEKEKADKVPVIRSFLLQLLLEYNTERVLEYLNVYLTKSRKFIQDNRIVCLLCMQCLEDAIFKQSCHSICQDNAKNAKTLLAEGETVVKQNSDASLESNITIEHLEAIAKLRFVCSVVGDLLYKYNEKGVDSLTLSETELLKSMKICCNDDKLNSMEAGPAVFILKQVARQHGMSFLVSLSKSKELEWVIPTPLRKQDEIIVNPCDPFLIYEVYGGLRSDITDVVYSQKLNELETKVKGLTPRDAVPLLLSIYQVVTMSHVYSDKDTRRVTDEAKSIVDKFTKKCPIFNRELKWTAQTLIQCTHCEKLEQMQPKVVQSSQDRMTTEVVVHAAITFQAKRTLDVMQPFIKLLYSPGELKKSYLPTFPGEVLPESVRTALGGAFNKCPRGHHYFISECGEIQRHKCPVCSTVVDRKNDSTLQDEKLYKVNDSQVGYILEKPDQCETHPPSERNLSPVVCSILRALVNACLVWTACTNENVTGDLLSLVRSNVQAKELPTFFWQHLERDIGLLSLAVGKSKDDACLILHLVLKNISKVNFPESSDMKTLSNLKSEEARAKWENSFDEAYIQPILKKLDYHVQEATQQLLKDKTEEQDYLYYTVYEKVAISPNTILPHLWSYRPRITLDHLYQILQTEKKDFPILHELLKEEPILRATQYLPGIVKLQHQLYELYHRKLDFPEANQMKITTFAEKLESDSKRTEFHSNLQCVKSAWELVKDKLKEYTFFVDNAQVHVPNEYLRVSWDDKSLLSYLIPTLTGPGVCTVALLHLLVTAHNGFVEKCQNELKKKQKKKNIWGEYKVRVSHIQYCHLPDYEHQIISIVLSHCHYSSCHGEGQTVTYDLPALEKHFVDRFVHGKPLIQFEIQRFAYRKDAYSITTIRKRVRPQVKLGAREQTEIINELHTNQSLRECLDIVEIVMGFLSSGQTNPNTTLRKFVSKSLKMEKQFTSKKALDYCKLEHILSLWETLSVEMAKRLTYEQQEPFIGLSEEYLHPLLKTEKSDQFLELREILHGVDIDSLLNILYEFIETFVRHMQHEELNSDWKLIETLAEYEHFDPVLNKDISSIFPKSITLGQAVATWKEIAVYQKNTLHTSK